MSESTIESKACHYARGMGFMCLKFTSPSQKGVPDRVFISRAGAVLFMEFKREGEKPAPLQMRMLEKLRAQNVAAGWVDNLDDARDMLLQFNSLPINFNRLNPL